MRLTRPATLQLSALAPFGAGLRFTYHGTPREGTLETLGEGPAGAFLLVRHPDGTHKSYSLAKVTDLRPADAPAGHALAPRAWARAA